MTGYQSSAKVRAVFFVKVSREAPSDPLGEDFAFGAQASTSLCPASLSACFPKPFLYFSMFQNLSSISHVTSRAFGVGFTPPATDCFPTAIFGCRALVCCGL